MNNWRSGDRSRAATTATVAGSPDAITPSAAHGAGLGNYTITATYSGFVLCYS